MSYLVPIALVVWIPLTVLLFFLFKPHHAAKLSVIGGMLFLPMAAYDFPGLPPITKNSVIAIGLITGGRLSGQRSIAEFSWSRYDFPMLIWCLCPLFSSLSNNLGVYDGLAGIWENIAVWGIPYLAGRIYIDTTEKLQDLCIAIIIGGLIYTPLCLYEIRMSPQLSNSVYGFFPHSWIQHIRYGGWRPIVFMQHGLMVALWMAVATTTAFWVWRTKLITHIKEIPLSLCTFSMIVTTVLCKSANGWIALVLGIGGYFLHQRVQYPKLFNVATLLIPLYMLLRITGGLESTVIENHVSQLFDTDRVGSLAVRLEQEDLFVDKMLQQPYFGWGHMSRAWPRVGDYDDGSLAIRMIDSLWIVVVSTRGLIGLAALTAMMLIGPWRVLSKHKITYQYSDMSSQIIPMVLSVIVLLFMIDCLVNGMINTVYILISGSLLGWTLNREEMRE